MSKFRSEAGSRAGPASSRSHATATTSAGDSLDLLGVPASTARLVRYLAAEPGAAAHGRQLQRILGAGSASMQRDLERLVGLGALERVKEGRLVRYRPVPASRFWQAVHLLLRASADVTPFVRDALRDVAGVEAGFIFGSTAEGTARPDSDIDLFVIESPLVQSRLLNARLAHIGLVLERQVNAVRYTPQALGERLGDPKHPSYRFVRQVLTGPKLWVAGSLEAIRPLAAAAGISMSGPSVSAA